MPRIPLLQRMIQLAYSTMPCLQDGSSRGAYLNSGRVYIDCGEHLEFATAECTSPLDLVTYLEAGHRLVAELAAGATGPGAIDDVFRINIDYGSSTGAGITSTWGSHQSHLHSILPSDLQRQAIPFLVTRIPICGAGGFDPFAPGLKFTLSPRSAFIHREVSSESTTDRGIYHTREEPLCRGYHRLHILGETLCSHVANLVHFGATSLVVAMADAGIAPGDAVQLDTPVAALHAVAADPSQTALLKIKHSSRRLTALEIQYHYLKLAEDNAGHPAMPPWTAEVCEMWRYCLDLLASGPGAGARTFDWQIKRALFAQHAERRGVRWDSFPFWNAVLERLQSAASCEPGKRPFFLDNLIGPNSPIPDMVKRLSRVLHENDHNWDELRCLVGLRSEFLALDWRFGQLGPDGIFTGLDQAGLLRHRVVGDDAIAQAVNTPPSGSRARIRGEAIARLTHEGRQGWFCQWDSICNRSELRFLDLSDPFTATESWRDTMDEPWLDSPFPSSL